MSYNKPEIVAGDMCGRESFSCGCPEQFYNGNPCMNCQIGN